ncbi:NHL domain-containing protein [Hymenobacter jeollabukensis]|uniref:Teneurin NHL domain-containing protein n=1 Tax=Hymenobacter jeollabukensis TaxID=2025313 RepID=A0A5R8WQH8_9BACT|nr:hypothetical protein [Hymenobacter jeollabukensis]TLM92997.1 hypothetical protein FDY95_10185 [Hymenobacter jeollabukensis]
MTTRFLTFLPGTVAGLLLVACHGPKPDDVPVPAPDPPQLMVSTLAGGTQAGNVDATGSSARFGYLWGATLDAQGNVYAVDHINGTIRRITPAGEVSTVADLGRPANIASGPDGVALGANGVLYVSMEGQTTLSQVSPAGVVSSLPGAAATHVFNYARSLAADAQGNIYVVELLGQRIDKVTPAGAVTVLAGTGTAGYTDGPGSQAQFSGPTALVVDAQGNVYVSDAGNYRIRKITPAGQVSTLAGSGTTGTLDGPGTTAQFGTAMHGLSIDAAGTLYLGDGPRIRRITPAGEVSTLVGSSAGYVDGPVAEARFVGVLGLVGNPTTGLYAIEVPRIRKIMIQ